MRLTPQYKQLTASESEDSMFTAGTLHSIVGADS